jgi:hypothetical protein
VREAFAFAAIVGTAAGVYVVPETVIPGVVASVILVPGERPISPVIVVTPVLVMVVAANTAKGAANPRSMGVIAVHIGGVV